MWCLSTVNLQMNSSQSHLATWPSKIQIAAAQERVVSPQEFLLWTNQNNGILCRILAQRRPETPPNNDVLLSQLVNSLAEKSMVSFSDLQRIVKV